MTLNNSILSKSKEEEEDSKEKKDDLSSKLLETRTIVISDQVNQELAGKVVKQLLLLEAEDPDKEIKVLINSPGGEIYSGYAIFDMLKFISCPITTIVMGFAASMGSILSLAGDKGRVLALPNSRVMIHQPLIGGTVQGQATDLKIQSDQILKTREKIAELYSNKTGKSQEQVLKDMNRNNWFTAKEALEYGLVDKIIKSRNEL